MEQHTQFMRLALAEAEKALSHQDVPVGAVVVRDGKVLGAGHNMREYKKSACAHAEILAIQAACRALEDWQLNGCELYVTLEPCPMCAGAILNARISRVYFGAYEEKYGAVGSRLNLYYDHVFPHQVSFRGGILEDECARLLQTFFTGIRRSK